MPNLPQDTLLDRAEAARLLADKIKALDEIRTRRSRSEGEMARLQEEIAAAEHDARAQFGTDDPDALDALSKQRLIENSRSVLAFASLVDDVQNKMKAAPGL